jgi:hypothetical protein
MPLSRRDCADLIRHIQGLLREYDPTSFETVLRGVDSSSEDPRRYLMALLSTIEHVYAERSGGVHGQILDSVNRYVRLPDGRPVRGLSVALTPGEREVYRTEEVNLAELPDRTEFVAELRRMLGIIETEIDWEGNRG